MPRPRSHSDEDILGAVRTLLISGGPRAVTTAAVSELSGAPTGSLYHRFGSRANMVAELWIRTIRSLQEFVVSAGDAAPRGVESAVAMAVGTVDFCAENAEDARLLTLASREKLQRKGGLSPENVKILETLNEPVLGRLDELASDCAAAFPGSELSAVRERLVFAAVSIPYVAVRQALNSGQDPAQMRDLVEAAARAVLSQTADAGTEVPRKPVTGDR